MNRRAVVLTALKKPVMDKNSETCVTLAQNAFHRYKTSQAMKVDAFRVKQLDARATQAEITDYRNHCRECSGWQSSRDPTLHVCANSFRSGFQTIALWV